MTQFLSLRLSPTGAEFIGVNQGDVPQWDATERKFFVGPQSGGGAVSSVFGRVGAVVATPGDYSAAQVANDSLVPGVTVADALNNLLGGGGAVVSVFGRVGIIVAAAGDYAASEVANDSGIAGVAVSDALNNLGGAISGLSLATTAPLAGGGLVSSGLTLSVADVSSTSSGVVPAVGASGTILASNGVAASWQPALTAPANPGDNGKTVIASGGNFTYFGGTVTGQALTWNNTTPSWVAGTDFGANLVTNSAGLQTTGAVGVSFLSIGLSAAGIGNAATSGNLRIQNGFVCRTKTSTGAETNCWDFGVSVADTITVIGLNAGGSIFTFPGASAASAGAFVLGQNLIQFAGGAPVLACKDTAAAGPFVALPLVLRGSNETGIGATVGGLLDIRGGDSTNGTGGNVTIRAGNGPTQGNGLLQSGAAVTKLTWSNVGLGFYAAPAVGQPTRVGQLTDSTTGTPATTLVDVTTAAVADPVKVNNNFASVLTKLNAIDSRLSQAAGGNGLTA